MLTLLNEQQHAQLMAILYVFEHYSETLSPDVVLPPSVDEMLFFAGMAIKELEETPVRS